MIKPELKSIPIIFIHKGFSEYFSYALTQARRHNPSSPIFILGDSKTNRPGSTTFVDIKKYEQAVKQFRKVYQPLSYNDPDIEQFCFERWFYMRELMREYNLDLVFACDSDVMLYSNVGDNSFINDNFTLACSVPEDQSNYKLCASAHMSFWKLKTIEDFCEFIVSYYSNPVLPSELMETWNYISSGTKLGGISDMALLQLFTRTQSTVLLNKVIDGATFDNNINLSENYYLEEYEMDNGIKKIIWKDNLPYGFNKVEKREIKFKALHCQGSSKAKLREFYERNNPKHKSLFIKFKNKLGRIVRKYT